MADIPVERTRSPFPWWLLLVGLLVLGAILWFATRGDRTTTDRTAVTTADTTRTVVQSTTVVPDGTIRNDDDTVDTANLLTNPARLVDPPASTDPAGRAVRFTDMRIDVAYSDSVFYATHVDGPPDRRFFIVVGDPAPAPAGPPSTLNVGDVVTVEGMVREPRRDELQRWDIAPAERDRLMRLEDYYVAARRILR